MQLSNKQEEFLQNFAEILEYGSSKIQSSNIKIGSIRAKKELLYFMMGATQSYSEALFKLISPPHIYDKAAEIMFRSLIETFINLNYIFNCKTQNHAQIFTFDSILDKIDFAKKYKRLMLEHPNWDLEFSSEIKVASDWDREIDRMEKKIGDIEHRYKIKAPKKIPDLKTRAKESDEYQNSKGKLKKKNSLEYYYVAFYKFFSQVTHLTASGIERFAFIDSNKDLIFVTDGNGKDVERIVPVAYVIYFVILKFFLDEFRIYDRSEFARFTKLSKAIVAP